MKSDSLRALDSMQKWMLERDRYQIEKTKIILVLASGTFIVTLSFISARVVMHYKGVLLLTWILLVMSIIFGMWAINAGITRYDNALKGKLGELTGKDKQRYEQGKVISPFEAQTPSLQQWSFTIGLISFLLFVILNTDQLLKW